MSKLAAGIYYFLSSYVIVLLISVFCYGKILMTTRRQASVMAIHNPAGSSTAQTQSQSNKLQSSVIKTMILVCAFFVIAWTPEKIFVLLFNLGLINASVPIIVGYYVGMALGFLYICANPLVYATKFDPVRRILKGLIPCNGIEVSESVN